MPVQIQELIHKFEVGTGSRALKLVLALFVVVGAGVAYNLAAFRNLTTAEGMDSAQLAWNISEGRWFTTHCIRPFSVHLIQKKQLAAQEGVRASPTNAAANPDLGRLKQGHPDLANPPFYPLLLAGFFKTIQLTPPDLSLESNKAGGGGIYSPDRWIAIFNQGLLVALGLMIFFLARRLFDEPVAWASAIVFLGTELFWRFSLSGLPTILLMILFVALLMVLVRLDTAMRAGNPSSRSLTGLAVAAGALTGLAGMTSYSFCWLIVPVVLWLTTLAGPKRAPLAVAASVAFLVVVAPWIVRNFSLSGAPFGTAGFALFENTSQFAEGELQRSLNADFSGVSAGDVWHKVVGNTREILQNELPRLGGSWVSAFFLVGLLVPFRNPTLNRLRWFLVYSLAILIVVEALGRTSPPTESNPVRAENFLVIVSPLVFIYGVSFFFVLLDQATGQSPSLGLLGRGSFYLIICAPFILSLLPPYPNPIVYPPYFPPYIQEKSWSVDKEGLIMSDIPWAVAWYGQRQSIALALKHRAQPTDRFKNDFYAVDAIRSVNALYLSAKTLKSLESNALEDWKEDVEGQLLNRLRRQVIDNQAREDKKEDDLRLFEKVRERLVANAENAEEHRENWERFVLTTYLKSEVPTGFPLTRAPFGLKYEIFLTDTERGKPKAIQSSK